MKIVAKFGGTSVGSVEGLRRIVEIVQQDPQITIVVVSAAHGVTNKLIEFANAPANGQKLKQQVIERYEDLARGFGVNLTEELKAASLSICTDFGRDIDAILMVGEDLSRSLVRKVLEKNGVAAREIDARSGVFLSTNNRSKVALDAHATRHAFEGNSCVLITQGFTAQTPSGQCITLPRGGGDTSAALIAAAIGADELRIYTDVDGIYPINPRLTERSSPLLSISYNLLSLFSHCGMVAMSSDSASVIEKYKVPTRVLSTFNPKARGTFITDTAPVPEFLVAGRPAQVKISINGDQARCSTLSTELGRCVLLLDEGGAVIFTSKNNQISHTTNAKLISTMLDSVSSIDTREYCLVSVLVSSEDGMRAVEDLISALGFECHRLEGRLLIIAPDEAGDDVQTRIYTHVYHNHH